GKAGTGAVWRWHQIARAAVNRDFEDSRGKARPIHDRFVVTGQESRAVTQLGYAQRAEIALEEDPCLLWCESTNNNRLAADVRQGEVHRAHLAPRQDGLKQGAATREECGKGGGVVIRCPAVERAPVEGLK